MSFLPHEPFVNEWRHWSVTAGTPVPAALPEPAVGVQRDDAAGADDHPLQRRPGTAQPGRQPAAH